MEEISWQPCNPFFSCRIESMYKRTFCSVKRKNLTRGEDKWFKDYNETTFFSGIVELFLIIIVHSLNIDEKKIKNYRLPGTRNNFYWKKIFDALHRVYVVKFPFSMNKSFWQFHLIYFCKRDCEMVRRVNSEVGDHLVSKVKIIKIGVWKFRMNRLWLL